MDKQLKITAISPEPKSWSSTYGPMLTYRVKLDETGDEVIELNKKPENVPKVGDEIFGHIEDSKNPDFPTRKFKAGNKPGFGGKSSGYQESPEKQSSIYRSVSLNNAATVFQGSGEAVSTILEMAESFNEWLENKPQIALDAKEVVASPKQKFEFKKEEDTVVDVLDDEPIDLSEIPF